MGQPDETKTGEIIHRGVDIGTLTAVTLIQLSVWINEMHDSVRYN